MKKKTKLIIQLASIISVSLSILRSEASYSLAETISFVEAAIPSSEEKKDEGTQEIKALMEKLVPYLPTYSFLDSEEIEDCIKSFGQEVLNATMITIFPLLGGASPDVLFLVEAENKQLVIKTFRRYLNENRHHHFFKEILGSIKIAKLGLQQMKSTEIVSAAACELGNGVYVMHGQTYFPGKPIGKYPSHILNFEIGSEERKIALQQATRAFGALGFGMAEFHYGNKKGQFAPIHPCLSNIFSDEFETAFNKISLFAELNIDLDEFSQYFDFLFDLANKTPFLHGFMHVDPNFGNYLVFENEQGLLNVGIIDVAKATISMTSNDIPIGMPGFDFFLITELYFQMEQMRSQTLFSKSLEDNEIASIISAFKEGYIKNGGRLMTDFERDFFELIQAIYYINWFLVDKYVHNDLESLTNIKDKKKYIAVHNIITRLKNALQRFNDLKKNLVPYTDL